MDKRLQIAAIVGAAAFSFMVLTSPDDPIPIPVPPSEGGSVEVLAEGLDGPRAIAVSGDRVFVTERKGLVRVVDNGTLLDRPLASFRAADAIDGGLLGIALDPGFEDNGRMYVFLTYEDGGELQNRIIRITEKDNRLSDEATILDGIPGSKYTNGGFLKFGPDGKLYAGAGTVSDASHLPRDVESLAGKILRMNPDGTIPDDNPFPGSYVYSTGHRDPRGMAWDDTGRMFAAETGPDKNDEINEILPGADHGWPDTECAGGTVLCYDPSIEPGGILFYSGHIQFERPFLMASLEASNLYQLDFEEGLPSQSTVLSGAGRIRDVAQGGDGSVYVITSNTDGRGFPDGGDDRLLRIVR